MGLTKHDLGILIAIIAMTFLMGNITACDGFWKTPTPTPTQPPTAVPTATATLPSDIPAEVMAARDAALAFLQTTYPGQAPPQGLSWVGRNTTPPGVVGSSSYEFVSGDWLMWIGTPQIAPGYLIYEMELTNQQTAFHWTGTLDANYTILESNLNVAIEVLIVREIVFAHVREHYPAQAPAEDLAWIGERTTPEGAAGRESYRFTARAWTMTVEYDLASPEQVIYEVELSNASTAFLWRGQVDAEGTVLEHR
nr:hypothetical protein [Chloroflexota bacterium]